MNRMLSVGAEFPDFNKKALVSTTVGKEFEDLSLEQLKKGGKWTVMFWWPMDFTFVCPTEIASFGDKIEDFKKLDTVLVGASTDSEYVHLAWRENNTLLKNVTFPMLADTSKSLASDLGILEADSKVAYRTTYIVDPQGVIRHVSMNDLSVGRNVDEVLRLLEALKTGELTPCGWKHGDDFL